MVRDVTKRYNVAYVMTPITFGGSEKVSLNFLKHVDRDKFNIELILFLRPWEDNNTFEAEIKHLGFTYTSIPVSNNKFFDLLRVPRCLIKLKEVIAANSYDLIHTHGYIADLLGFIVSNIINIPIVSTCHGFIKGGIKLSLYNNLDLMVLNKFDKIIAVSDAIRNDLLVCNVNVTNITVIENATSTPTKSLDICASRNSIRKFLQIESDEQLLGYFGRLSEEKGILYLLEAVKLLEEFSLPIKLVIIGEGPQRELLTNMAVSKKILERIIFVGFQKNIEEWLAAVDIFVLPSLSEGTPMALLEAMSMRLPCIASAVGGISKIIDSGEDGILVAPGNPEEIRDAVRLLVSDRERSLCMAKNAQLKIEQKYNVHTWARSIENEYVRTICLTQ